MNEEQKGKDWREDEKEFGKNKGKVIGELTRKALVRLDLLVGEGELKEVSRAFAVLYDREQVERKTLEITEKYEELCKREEELVEELKRLNGGVKTGKSKRCNKKRAGGSKGGARITRDRG